MASSPEPLKAAAAARVLECPILAFPVDAADQATGIMSPAYAIRVLDGPTVGHAVVTRSHDGTDLV
jgi:hypothetical protein